MNRSQITEICQFLGLTTGTDEWWQRIGMYEGWGVWIFWLFWAFLIGSCMGSFLNVCVIRIPRGESVSDQASHCLGCGMLIRWYDNIPLYSYLRLRGKCRKCGMSIPPRYFLMELFTGLLYAGAVAKAGWSGQSPEVLALTLPLLSLALITFQIDWKCRLIPDQTTYPVMVIGLLAAGLLPGGFAREVWWEGLLFSGAGLAGMGILLSLFAVIGEKLAGQEVFGWGDVKYMMAAGALTGLPGALFILTCGSFAGVLFGLYVGYLRHRRQRKWQSVRIPLGPFLAIASALWVFAGEELLRLWLFRGL
ncbi:MAG: prepilin peptidase [Lentisphaeria bacterium]|nr:prepilin peptidase [Lentisphaeria bacterium]